MSNINTCIRDCDKKCFYKEKIEELEKKINCNKDCFYKEKAEKYKQIIEDFQKDIIGEDILDPIQDQSSKYSGDPILYAYMVNNKYIKSYIKSIQKENRVLTTLIVLLIVALIITNFI